MYGQLVPRGWGDPVPLLKKRLVLGRREGSDIRLSESFVSSEHALLEVREGYWFVTDLRSSNGVRIENRRIEPATRKRLDPGDIVHFGKLGYRIDYEPVELGAWGMPPPSEMAGG